MGRTKLHKFVEEKKAEAAKLELARILPTDDRFNPLYQEILAFGLRPFPAKMAAILLLDIEAGYSPASGFEHDLIKTIDQLRQGTHPKQQGAA